MTDPVERITDERLVRMEFAAQAAADKEDYATFMTYRRVCCDPKEHLVMIRELASRRAADAGMVEIGLVVAVPDGLGTRMVAWNNDKDSLPVGAKIYARTQP